MNTLQKLFNHLVGVHAPWYAQYGTPVATARAPLPQRVELPACWRRRARRAGGVSTMIRG
jgi:hypothetical protein